MASHLDIFLILLREYKPFSGNIILTSLLLKIHQHLAKRNGMHEVLRVQGPGICFVNTPGGFPHVGRVENHCSRCCDNYSELHQTDRDRCTRILANHRISFFDLSFGRLSLEHVEECCKKPTCKLYTEITQRPFLKCPFVKP